MFCLNAESDCILLVVVKMYCIVSTHPPLVSFCCVFTPWSYWISPAHNHGADIELSTSPVVQNIMIQWALTFQQEISLHECSHSQDVQQHLIFPLFV